MEIKKSQIKILYTIFFSFSMLENFYQILVTIGVRTDCPSQKVEIGDLKIILLVSLQNLNFVAIVKQIVIQFSNARCKFFP